MWICAEVVTSCTSSRALKKRCRGVRNQCEPAHDVLDQVGFLDESTELFLLDEAAKEAADGDSDALQSEKPSAAVNVA